MIIKNVLSTLKIALLLLASYSANAANFSFTGDFTHDNDVQLFSFSIAADSTTVAINTLSLNGGVNLNGATIAGGGFNPYLALFEKNTGNFVLDTINKLEGDDAEISNNLPHFYGILSAGSYILALTQLDNVAAGTNLSEGFADDLGLATFESIPFTTRQGGGSGHWAVDIADVDVANVSSVPLPGALPLLITGLISLAAVAQKKNRGSLIKTGLIKDSLTK